MHFYKNILQKWIKKGESNDLEIVVAQIRYITANWNKILQSVSGKESPDKDAAKKLVALIEEFVGKK